MLFMALFAVVIKGVEFVPVHLLALVLFDCQVASLCVLRFIWSRLFAHLIAFSQLRCPLTGCFDLSDHPVQFRPELRLVPEQLFHLPHRYALIFKLHGLI